MILTRWVVLSIVVFSLLGLVVASTFFPSLQLAPSEPQDSLPKSMTVYAYGPSGLLSKQSGGAVAYYHTDYLSSSSLVTDTDGKTVYRSDYEPFGDSLHTSGEERYTYTGKELDSSTGLYYYGARYYDASLGRFISVDPVQGSLYSGQRLNRYSYVMNNPMVYVDPTGMDGDSASILISDLIDIPPFEIIDAVYNLVESYSKQGINIEGIYLLPQSYRYHEELERRDILEQFIRGLNKEGIYSATLTDTEAIYSYFKTRLEDDPVSILAILGHSEREANGNLDVSLLWNDRVILPESGSFNYRADTRRWALRIPGDFDLSQRGLPLSGHTCASVEVYGCALGGPGRRIYSQDYGSYTRMRGVYDYKTILDIADDSDLSLHLNDNSGTLVVPPSLP